MTEDPEASSTKRRYMGRLLVGIALVVGFLILIAGPAGRRLPAAGYFLLWSLGEVVIPVWEAIDPTAPRLPNLTDDVARLKDVDARGKALRATIDKFYVSLPETRKSWLREVLAPPYAGAAIDISEIARHYIPAGTSFGEAESILLAAGMTIVSPRLAASQGTPRRSGAASQHYPVMAELRHYTSEPAGYMRLSVHLFPQSSGDDGDGSPVGKVTAWLDKQIGAPIPPLSVPFDASKASTAVDVTIRIGKERYYEFDFVFRGDRAADMPAINKLAGETYLGEAFLDERYRRPDLGIVVPIRIVVTNDAQQVLYDRTIDTRGHYAFGSLKVLRKIGGLRLGPGVYHVRASTLKDIPELSVAKIEFSVSYDARI
jgi:hypothetical protein